MKRTPAQVHEADPPHTSTGEVADMLVRRSEPSLAALVRASALIARQMFFLLSLHKMNAKWGDLICP
jgi:hypothetical protein